MIKAKFIRRSQKRFLLRFHPSLILMATFLNGVLFSMLVLFNSVRDVLIRYLLTLNCYAEIYGRDSLTYFRT